MVSSNTVCMKSKWQGGFIHFFRRKVQGLFKDFPGPYFNLYEFTSNQAKCLCWKLCFGYQHIHMQKSQTIQGELENTCKPDIHCALVAQWTCAKVMKEQWEQNECFHTFCKNFENFILCIPEHLFSFTLKLLSVDVFRFCSIKKNQGHSRTKTNFKHSQGLSMGLLKFKGFQDVY